MSSSRTRLNLAIAWLLFWGLMTATAIQEYLRNDGRQLWKPVVWELTSFVTVTLLLYLQRRSTARHDALVGAPVRWFARQLVWLPVYWVAFTPLAFGMRHLLYGMAGDVYTHQAWPEVLLYENVKMTVFFFIFTTITFGILSYHAMLAEKLRLERVNASLREVQLLRLTQQLQPHFLFNALNTISSLMHTDVHRADAMLVQLADVLRATLDVGEQHQAPLSTELRLLRGYAALMAERFADRVSIAWRIDEDDRSLLDCPVPVMSMQPLLENIFKHTVERRRQPTAITISAHREDGMLVLRVEDDSGRLAPVHASGTSAAAASGIGVRNLRQRLVTGYGSAATFDLIQLAPAGVRAEMRLPCGC
ncbi:sensor protein LytS [Duganella sp. Leaf126]|uniref:sensor histidine kinase n=1 Tax=Duganella sp. Leaf126 TaxID=1736266 RepID=UPI0007003F6E|nr:histidine kinase [Duganella sp. Leaf126]KQQ40521.1 sensor protein LytS [Duganella sp. Leaf126]